MIASRDDLRGLTCYAAGVGRLAAGLSEWMDLFRGQRSGAAAASIDEADDVALAQLCRTAEHLQFSATVPAAAAVYGPSQSGKSLFLGRILKPRDAQFSPLGRAEEHGAPGYLTALEFETDLNPQSGSNEATALVTRFTTHDRFNDTSPPEYPVVARAMTQAQLLCVMARGFSIECATKAEPWTAEAIRTAAADIARRYPASQVDRRRRRDLLDAYAYMKSCEPVRFVDAEATLAAVLSESPLTADGYIALAARLFWNDWRSLTGLYVRVSEFLNSLNSGQQEPSLSLPWSAVRFLLDSKRSPTHERRNSRCFTRVDWSDFRLTQQGRRRVLEHRPGLNGGREPLEIIQAAMLELVVPLLAHRLQDDWREIFKRNDVLDIPGLRAGRQGSEQGKRIAADDLEEQLEILKRGKVCYLFEHYVAQFQIQTLLLLARGGNLEVTAQMKAHLDRWGEARYGIANWPRGIRQPTALFVGLTGIDEEFRTRSEFAEPALYDARLAQLVDALGTVATDYGGRGRPFTNFYPLRYPGTWDADSVRRESEGSAKWSQAEAAFLASSWVNRFIADPAERWNAALRDDDGGLSFIRDGWLAAASPAQKQEQLQARLTETRNGLLGLARRWIVNTDGNDDRRRRESCATTVLDWLTSDAGLIYHRVAALRQVLCLSGDKKDRLADFVETATEFGRERPNSPLQRFTQTLRQCLDEWADQTVPQSWDQLVKSQRTVGPWLMIGEISRLAGYLRDYFCSKEVFASIVERLWKIVNMKLRDENALRESRRSFVRLALDDMVLTPGLPIERMPAPSGVDNRDDELGLMTPFVRRWQSRLPVILAAGGGVEAPLPAGNQELIELLEQHPDEA